MSLLSGVLRNRFRVVLNSGLVPPGFVYNQTRLPGREADKGTAMIAGAFLDGSNAEALDRFNFIIESGVIEIDWWRSSILRGQPFLHAGFGDNDDLELSGIDVNPSGTQWFPVVEGGNFFDLDTPYYLFTQDAIEQIVSGSDPATLMDEQPAEFKPVIFASYHVNDWGRARPYDWFTQKYSFTPIDSGSSTLNPNEPRWQNIRWGNVDSGHKEFIIDRFAPGVIRNQDFVHDVQAIIRRVPWSQEYFQLPLVPVVAMGSGILNVKYEPISWSGGQSSNVIYSGFDPQFPWVLSVNFCHLSGAKDIVESGFWRTTGSTSGFSTNGYLLVSDDDRWDEEIIGYSGVGTSGFNNITRALLSTSASNHRVDTTLRQIYWSGDFDFISGAYVSGLSLTDGQYLVSYWVNNPPMDVDARTGLVHMPMLSGTHGAVWQTDYERGLFLTYEPSGSTENVFRASGINISPLNHGINHGIIWLGMFPLIPAHVDIIPNRRINDDGTVGPVYTGNDFLVVTAKVLSKEGAPVPGSDVTLVLEEPLNIGKVDGLDPVSGLVTKTTDGAGEAKFVFTPPDTVNGMGYFVPSGSRLGTSGLTLPFDVPIEEIWSSGAGFKTLLFAVFNDDQYLTFSETSGLLTYSADGRFELVSVLSGTHPVTGYTIWKPVLPVELRDVDDSVITASGTRVHTIVYPAASLPTDEEIGAYFVSAERRISVGAIVADSQVASKSLEVVMGIPQFMTGEFFFGPVEAPDTSALDSLSYLTINPFQNRIANIDRRDPRELGNVFRIRGSKQIFMRNKFTVGIDYPTLDQTTVGKDTIRKIHAFRNRFILEI